MAGSHAFWAGAVTVVLCFTLSAPARAQSVGLEVDLGIPVGDTADVLDLGFGLEGRAGYGLPLPVITLDVEALFDWYTFPFDAVDESAKIWRVAGGLRVGVGIPYVPDLFGHIGYGNISSTVAGVEADDSGLTWDIGLASELVSLAVLSLGIHIAYKKLSPGEENGVEPEPTTWVGLGVHGEVGF